LAIFRFMNFLVQSSLFLKITQLSSGYKVPNS
jgi:hypothetical protein